jgi:DNA-binding response OmpR family regulator
MVSPTGSTPGAGRIVGVGKLTVLVIDDDPVILELLRVNFEIEGFDVICAGDGEEGFRRAQADHPDIVISDIMMPRRDGLQLLNDLKADPSTEDLPVILLSAKAQRAEVQQGLELGADDYITKPFDPLELIDRLNAVMTRPRR